MGGVRVGGKVTSSRESVNKESLGYNAKNFGGFLSSFQSYKVLNSI